MTLLDFVLSATLSVAWTMAGLDYWLKGETSLLRQDLAIVMTFMFIGHLIFGVALPALKERDKASTRPF